MVNVLSLFSGIGGLDLGLQRAGMTIAGQVEIDPWCRMILAKHWPEVPRHDDVRTCAAWWGDRAVDLVCGGFPCQPTSGAGKREVEADSRWLWPAFRDVIRDLRPRYVLVENPSSGFFAPVIVKNDQGGFLGYSRPPIEIVLGDLAALGYDGEWDCVPACFVGAPHIRDRVWIVAYPQRDGLRQQPVTESGSGRAAVAAVNGQIRHVADAAGSRRAPRQSGTRRQVRDEARRPEPERRSGHVADADSQARDGARPASQTVFRPGTLERPRRCGCSERHTWPAEPGVGRSLDGVSAWLDGTWEHGIPRTASGIPRRVDRLRGLGNAVVPQVAEHIGRLIMEAA